MNHTPGPWNIREEGEANRYAILADNKWLITFLHNGEAMTEKQRANARLIAAAPDLLAVVQRLFHSVNGLSATFSAVNRDYACSQFRKELTETIRESQNAIAKATSI